MGVAAAAALLMLSFAFAPRAHAQTATDSAEKPTMSELLKMPGKVIAESDAHAAVGKYKVKNYLVEELTLPKPVSAEVGGKRVEVSRAFRVTVTGGPFPVRALPPVVWIDDAPVGYAVESEDLDAVTAVTFDESILREGATLYLSYGGKNEKKDAVALPEKLKLKRGADGARNP